MRNNLGNSDFSDFNNDSLIQLIIKAGRLALEYYDSSFSVSFKDNKSPLTDVDLAVNSLIIDFIKKNYPDDAILSEETSDDFSRLSKERVWVIDPIDGTKEFIKHNGEFTINLALVENKKPVLGLVYAPVINKLYYAGKDGAFLLIIKDDSVNKVRSISVSNNSTINSMVLARSRSHASETLLRIISNNDFKDVTIAGSSLKGCLIAEGVADAYFRLGSVHEWDVAAMHAVLARAGGIITDLDGNVLTYNNKDTLFNGLIASNDKNHGLLLKLLRDESDG